MCNDRRITLNDTPKALLEIWIAIKKLSKRLKKRWLQIRSRSCQPEADSQE